MPESQQPQEDKFKCPKCGNTDLSKLHLHERGLYSVMGLTRHGSTVVATYAETEGYDMLEYALVCDCGQEWTIPHDAFVLGL